MRAILTAAADHAGDARRELDAVLPAGAHLEDLAPGVWLLSCPGAPAQLARELWATVFVRHLAPVQLELPVAPPPPDHDEWLRALLLPRLADLPGWPPPGPVQVQARILPGGPNWHPGRLAASLRAALGGSATGGPADLVLAVALEARRAHIGLARRADLLSPWPGGEARLRRRPEELSRSARKLEEALLLFGVTGPPGGPGAASAVDLGAAPGGWTQLLLRLGWRVVAVDSGALSPSLNGAPGLTFLRGSALQVPLPPGPCHLLTADLSWDPMRAADCALRFRPCLAPGAAGVFTVKFFGRDPLATVAEVRRRLQQGYRVRAVRHLFHDRGEATAHLEA